MAFAPKGGALPWGVSLGLCSALALSACGDDLVAIPDPEEEIEQDPPIEAEEAPPPITGGTMLITDDDVVVVADAGRDRVSLVSLDPPRVFADVNLNPGAEPGRVVQGSGELIHVALRGFGSVLTIDGSNGEIIDDRDVCTDPRGMAVVYPDSRLYVACADGTVVSMPETAGEGEVERFAVEPDLRDIVVDGGQLLLTRFRSVDVEAIGFDGTRHPSGLSVPGESTALPTAAWRMRKMENDSVAILHQLSATRAIPIAVPHPNEPQQKPAPAYGGGGGGGGDFGCRDDIVRPAITVFRYGERDVVPFNGPTPVVDMAASTSGSYAVAVAGAVDGESNVLVIPPGGNENCDEARLTLPGQPVAVEWTSDNRLVVQSREPGELYILTQHGEHTHTIELASTSLLDTGHEFFHRSTEAGIACASCHPEGADDGHVWKFEEIGLKRTQCPEVGLAGTVPFHWNGELADMVELSNEVFSRRMGAEMQSETRLGAFENWLFSIERPPANGDVDDELAAEGEALFDTLGCQSCHSGSGPLTLANVDIHGKMLQVPSLRRVSHRAPYMHDGRATTLDAAIRDMVDATRPGADLSDADVEALSNYLRKL